MAKIMLDVPDGETCEGCEQKTLEVRSKRVGPRECCPFQSGMPEGWITPDELCLAALVKPIVLYGATVRAGKEWWAWLSMTDADGLVLYVGTFMASKRNAKRGAERWVAKNLPGAVIEWEA